MNDVLYEVIDMSELEEALQQFQMQNQQLQIILAQKQGLVIQNREIEKALDELKKSERKTDQRTGRKQRRDRLESKGFGSARN
jgi:chaperonin cofactor prefoldin